jgi:hypothetical protein
VPTYSYSFCALAGVLSCPPLELFTGHACTLEHLCARMPRNFCSRAGLEQQDQAGTQRCGRGKNQQDKSRPFPKNAGKEPGLRESPRYPRKYRRPLLHSPKIPWIVSLPCKTASKPANAHAPIVRIHSYFGASNALWPSKGCFGQQPLIGTLSEPTATELWGLHSYQQTEASSGK